MIKILLTLSIFLLPKLAAAEVAAIEIDANLPVEEAEILSGYTEEQLVDIALGSCNQEAVVKEEISARNYAVQDLTEMTYENFLEAVSECKEENTEANEAPKCK